MPWHGVCMAKSSARTHGRFVKGTSGNPTGARRRDSIRRDDWQNFFTGVGVFGKDKRVGTNFHLHQLSFDQLKDLWLGDDLAARAVETIPKEALRQGYDIVISNSQKGSTGRGGNSGMDPIELSAEVTQKLDVLGADEYLETAGYYERGYGGGAVLIGANDGQADLTKPLNLNKVKSIDWLTPLEARELMPLYAYADPRAPKFGQPEIYQLTSRSVLPSFSGNFASATMSIHESRLLLLPGIRVSRYQVTTARGGWGESVLSRVYRVLRDFNSAWSSAGVLVTDFAQSVIKIAGLWEALALDGNQAFANRLAAMEYGRSVVNAITIDAGDEYSRQQTPLTGLPDLLEKFAVRLAAACDMPLTLLFGTSPAGMNATGESDVRFFYDRVAAYQKRKMEPALRRLCQIIFRTIGNKREPDKWNVKFRPLWQDSAKDKAAAMFTQAQADNIWIQAGVLSPEEVAAAHWGKGEYDPNITVDFDAREAQEAATSTPVDQDAINAMDPDHHTYQPPPEPGTAGAPGEVPPPGKPAAPDPNTRPVQQIQSQDSADRIDERDERARFAGRGYGSGVPSAQEMSARGSHERMAADHARAVAHHAAKARELNQQAEDHARDGAWTDFAETSREAIRHQAKAAQSLAKVTFHAERAGTDTAREHAADAVASMTRRDEWSDAAREAALEARLHGASQKAATAVGHATDAHRLTEKAKQTGKMEDHRKAAQAHEQASRSFERAGSKFAPEADAHEKAASEHREQAPRPTEEHAAHAAVAEKLAQPKGPVAAAPDREHGPVPPPAGHAPEAPSAHGAPAHGGEHAPGAPAHGGEHGHGKGKHGEHKPAFGKKLLAITKGAGEIVGGEKASKLAEQLNPLAGGGEGEEE